MKTLHLSLVLLALLSSSARADMDHEAERRRATQRESDARAQAQRQREADAMKQRAMTDGYRKMLGAKAVGKSDAEVESMARQMQGDAATAAQSAAARPRPAMPARSEAQMHRDAAEGMDMLRRANGGRALSQEDLANMSDAELDALARRAAANAQRR